MAKENLECSFCGRKKPETNLLIAGLDAHICDRWSLSTTITSDFYSRTLKKMMLRFRKVISSWLGRPALEKP